MMAAGEYISVSSQADTEKADLDKELHELTHNAERELFELTKIYEKRGLDHVIAMVGSLIKQYSAVAIDPN